MLISDLDIYYVKPKNLYVMNAFDFFHQDERICSDYVRTKVEKLAQLVTKLKNDGVEDSGVIELYNRYLRAETPAEKAKFYFEDLFDTINRWGVSFQRGYVIKTIQRGEFPAWIACFPGVLIQARGDYKHTCETLRNFIHLFKDRERCFEINEVNEEKDQLKSKKWKANKAVLWNVPGKYSLEEYADCIAETARYFHVTFGYVPKVYVYESSETGIWVKSICKDPGKETVWCQCMKMLAENLEVSQPKLFCKAVLWMYKQDAEVMEKLPEEVLAAERKVVAEEDKASSGGKNVFGAEMMVPGVCTCDCCGAVIPMTGFETGGDHLCGNCIRLERGEIRVADIPASHKPQKTECSATDDGRPSC